MFSIRSMDDDLRFSIDMWGLGGSLLRTITRSSSIVVAKAALESAIAEYPGARLTLSHGGRLIDGTERREREAEDEAQVLSSMGRWKVVEKPKDLDPAIFQRRCRILVDENLGLAAAEFL